MLDKLVEAPFPLLIVLIYFTYKINKETKIWREEGRPVKDFGAWGNDKMVSSLGFFMRPLYYPGLGAGEACNSEAPTVMVKNKAQ